MTNYKIDNLHELITPKQIDETHMAYGDFIVDMIVSSKDANMIKFNPAELDRAYTQNTGIISWIGTLAGKAAKQAADYKIKRDYVKAIIADEIRTKEIAKTGKPPSEARIDSEMRLSPMFIQVSAAEALAVEIEKTTDALITAVRRRGSDLDYFAAKQAAERVAKNSYSQK